MRINWTYTPQLPVPGRLCDLGHFAILSVYLHCSFTLDAIFKMMLDTAGGIDQANASVDDFYANDAAGHHVFSNPGTPAGTFAGESDGHRISADQMNPMPEPPSSRATVSLGGSPPVPGGLSGTLDARKVPGGAKFAVSQIHGVYLALHRLVLSRCAPWTEFASSASFQRPGTGAAAVDRMERNMRYFRTNYLCICCALGAVCALLNPIVLFIAAVCGGLCAFAAFRGEVQIGETTVPKKSFQGAVCVGGGCMLFLFAGNVVMTLLFLCSIVVAMHAALHKGVSYDVIAQKSGAPHPDLGV